MSFRSALERNKDGAAEIGLTKHVEIASLDALNEVLGPIDCLSYGHVAVQISGVFNASITFEGSNDGQVWYQCNLASINGSRGASFNSTNLYAGPIPFRHFQARCSAYTSGAIDVTAVFSTIPSVFSDSFPSDNSFGGLGVIGSGFNGSNYDRLRTIAALVGDGYAGTGLLAAGAALFNGSTFERARSNFRETSLASAARAPGTTNGPDQNNWNGRGVAFYIDVTNVQAAGSLAVKVQTRDLTSGGYVDIDGADTGGLGTTGTRRLAVYPGIAERANREVSDVIDRVYRVVATVSVNTVTFSVGVSVIS